jgi:hypothetical protein
LEDPKCDFDPVPGFHRILIGWPQYGIEWIFVVFPLVVGFLRLGTVLTDSEEYYSSAGPLARIRLILIGMALAVIGACISAFIIEPSDSARRLWRAVPEPHVSAECLQSFHAMDNMASALGGLIFLLGFLLPFGLGMLFILTSGRRARQARSATFT